MKRKFSSMKTTLEISHSSLGYCWDIWSVESIHVISKNVKDVCTSRIDVQEPYDMTSHLRGHWSKRC